MDLRDQRASRVDHLETTLLSRFTDSGRNTMSTENGAAADGDFIEFLYENSPSGREAVNNVAVVNDFLAHIDRGAVDLQREFDDVNCTHHSGAKPARLEQVDDFIAIGGSRRAQV